MCPGNRHSLCTKHDKDHYCVVALMAETSGSDFIGQWLHVVEEVRGWGGKGWSVVQ